MDTVRVALDWHPNTNHAGIFVALSKHLYSACGLNVELIPAPVIYGEEQIIDGVRVPQTPAGYVLHGLADLAVCPSETVISAFPVGDARGKGKHLVAVAALLNADTSTIVTRSDITRPRDLDGKAYGSYGARYEGRIVQSMIKHDGGDGEYEEITPAKLGVVDCLQEGKCDATWVFMGWEGIEAKRKGLRFNEFTLGEYGIPYGYSPLLVASSDIKHETKKRDVLKRFLKATSFGYEKCVANPTEAARLFIEGVKSSENDGLVLEYPDETIQECFLYIAPHIISSAGKSRWGEMDNNHWEKWLDWLSSNGMLTTCKQSRNPDIKNKTVSLDDLRAGRGGETIPRENYKAEELFTNELLPKTSKEKAHA